MTTIDTSNSEDSATQFDALYKVLLVGDADSGTRSIFDTIEDDNEFVTEAGDDFKVKFFDILDLKVKFEIWNTYKQMRSRRIADGYFINARGVLMLYETSDRSAFINMRNWFSHIKNKGGAHVQVVLVGFVSARSDQDDEGKTREILSSSSSAVVVGDKEGEELASELGISYCAVREGDAEDVQRAFLQLFRAMGSDLEHSRMGMGLQDYCTVM